jgi:DNA-binding HxlR family transcriptional regulator
LKEFSFENRILKTLLDGPKTFREIKASFPNVDALELNKILGEMREDGFLEFHTPTGLWRSV